jgi:DNA-binding CsgD family transcriptional regulator
MLTPFEARARELDRPWALATAARCRGLLAAARDELDVARAALAESLAHQARVAEPFEAARAELALGSVLRRLQRKSAARATLERARGTFAGLGARLWAEAAERELRRIGGRAAATTTLSETERRIVELVAAGRTNGEVAASLHVSAKTVEWNLTKVFRKVGVRSRTELAAYAAGAP